MAAFSFTKSGDQKVPEREHTVRRASTSSNASPTGNTSLTYATPLTGLIILTTMFASLTCIPYFASRRHLLRLEGTIRELSQTNRLMRRELSLNASRAQSRYDEQFTRLKEEVSQLGKGVVEVRGSLAQDSERLSKFQSALAEFRGEQRDVNSELNSQLLFIKSELTRQEEINANHENHFREIGATLGDIAGFMHEMQIGYGLFPDTTKTQRVESMRQVALRLQSMGEQKDVKETRKEQEQGKEPFETSSGPFD
ncbi:hypothetical protein SCHPADRAFT_995530 [Schizopora paradoxa]|uniref:Uncharacterized protein n=1 Tax=Schizopora paradoxa TaxID=27342 RepID=A0A0H2SFN1_9AGAM|nr:hypothetical protein SCHPADRAFT_995530 [Schizopora paradoxa]